MTSQGLNIQLTVKEIYAQHSPKCKAKVQKLIKDKITDEMVSSVIGK